MKTLAIDTSTYRSAVFVAVDGSVIASSQLPCGHSHSRTIVAHIRDILLDAHLSFCDIDAITVTVGPGSYTGIRVGVTVAKALAFAWNIPVITLCSLEGFIPDHNGTFAAAIDAKISGVYLLKGTKEGNMVRYSMDPVVSSWEEVCSVLGQVDSVVTPELRNIEKKITHYLGDHILVSEKQPSLHHLALRAEEKFTSGDICPADSIDILYLRKTQAEIEYDANRG